MTSVLNSVLRLVTIVSTKQMRDRQMIRRLHRMVLKLKNHREAVIIIIALIVYCVLAYLFRIPCPIKYITGVSCPGCGMTRSLSALVTLDFGMAVYYHPMIFVILPAAPLVYFLGKRNMHRQKKIVVCVLVLMFLAVYLFRFLCLRSPVLVFEPENGIYVRLFGKLSEFFGRALTLTNISVMGKTAVTVL